MMYELAVLVAYMLVISLGLMACVVAVSCTVSLIIGIIEELMDYGNDRTEELPFLRRIAEIHTEGRRDRFRYRYIMYQLFMSCEHTAHIPAQESSC